MDSVGEGGSLNSPSYFVRNPTLAPQLEETPETPPSSRAEAWLHLKLGSLPQSPISKPLVLHSVT